MFVAVHFAQYYFEERFDLVKFAKLVAAEGLFLFLRIGPYACAEWNFGSVYILAFYFISVVPIRVLNCVRRKRLLVTCLQSFLACAHTHCIN